MSKFPISLAAEQLDQLADEEGFIRFELRSEQRRAVIFVNIERPTQAPAMEQGLENYFELLQYPGKQCAFSFDETFAKDEVERIGKAIRGYFSSAHLSANFTSVQGADLNHDSRIPRRLLS